MPKELICVSPFQLQWRDYEDPPLKAKDVRIRATFGAAKHGTELSLFSGVAANRGPFDEAMGVFRPSEPHEAFPFGIGNMVVGEVIEADPSVTSVKLGDRVLTYGSLKPTHTVSESECWLMPAGMPWQSAVCLDPADFALAALRDANLRIGDGLAVFGLGAIALILVQMARLAGADPIIAIDPLAARREIAKRLGATHTLNPREEDVGLALKAVTQGRGVDVAIEYSGSVQALQAALRGVAFGGTVVCGAFPPPYAAGLDLGAEAHMNVPNLVFSRACSEPLRDHPRWNNARIYASCFSMLAKGLVTGVGIVSEPVELEAALESFADVVKEPGKIIKLGVKF